jgi:hypothetical protein
MSQSNHVIAQTREALKRLFPQPARQAAAIAVEVRWIWTAEALSSVASSASCYDGVENIRVASVIEPEGKLVHVERQVFFRDVMKLADDAAL